MVMAPGQLLTSSSISAGKTPSLTVREDGLQLGPIPLQSASFPRGPAARGFVSAKVQASRAGSARRMLGGGARRTARGSFPCASWWSVARPHLALDIMCYSDGRAAPAEGEQKQLGGVEHRSRARPRWRQRAAPGRCTQAARSASSLPPHHHHHASHSMPLLPSAAFAQQHAAAQGGARSTAQRLPTDGSQTQTQTQPEAGPSSSPAPDAVLRLRGSDATAGRRVVWEEGTVDNEHLGRKSSKSECVQGVTGWWRCRRAQSTARLAAWLPAYLRLRVCACLAILLTPSISLLHLPQATRLRRVLLVRLLVRLRLGLLLRLLLLRLIARAATLRAQLRVGRRRRWRIGRQCQQDAAQQEGQGEEEAACASWP